MKLRRFTTSGLENFSKFLDDLANVPDRLLPLELLESSVDSEPAGTSPSIVMPAIVTRFELGKHLVGVIGKSGLTEVDSDAGLWAWLTLVHFDVVCPAGADGTRKIRERAAYLPEPHNYQRYYRHLLLGPYLIYHANEDNPERAMALLCKPPHVIDDVVAQLAARQEFITNRAVVELSQRLYFDPSEKRLKKGAGGKGKGSARRLADVLSQFDVTWDLYAMSCDDLIQLLPQEFERFNA